MAILRSEVFTLKATVDIVNLRQAVRRLAIEAGLSLVDQTKIVTAVSEIGRNTIVYGRGGTAKLDLVNDNARKGLRVTFEDKGPGIPDVELALKDGYGTGSGLGLGLGGARRLVNEFQIESRVNEGTRVTLVKWK
jgi:serine/threonine-protein kinase RsbT